MRHRTFERAVLDWLGDGSDRTPPPAIDAVLLAVKTIPQERGGQGLRRFTTWPTHLRVAAALVMVAILGIGGLIAVSAPVPVLSQPTPTPVPTAPTPAPTEVAPGITSWTTYTSTIHGTTFGYPADWSVRSPATRAWQAGDAFPAQELPYADSFSSPGEADAQIGLVVFQLHIDIFTGTANLPALARKFCAEVLASSCETFTDHAVPLDFKNADQQGCAILVPTQDQQFAFLSGSGCVLTEATSWITVVVITRPDVVPAAERYGGSVQLLRSVVSTMNVSRP
jgi:hypothetical protein